MGWCEGTATNTPIQQYASVLCSSTLHTPDPSSHTAESGTLRLAWGPTLPQNSTVVPQHSPTSGRVGGALRGSQANERVGVGILRYKRSIGRFQPSQRRIPNFFLKNSKFAFDVFHCVNLQLGPSVRSHVPVCSDLASRCEVAA